MMNALRKTLALPYLCRLQSTASAEFVNRNPRNLERLRIARKPDGYHLEKQGKKFWHKYQISTKINPTVSGVNVTNRQIDFGMYTIRLVISPSNRTVTAEVVHYLNGTIIEAKTSEWALRKQLYSPTDTCAYITLGKVLAQRCLESGINEMYCDIEATEGGKIEKFLNEVVNCGIRLKEPDSYKNPQPWDRYRPEKPWEVHEE